MRRVSLYKGGSTVYVDSPLKHGGNVAVMLADLGLSRLPVVSSHVQVGRGLVCAQHVIVCGHMCGQR